MPFCFTLSCVVITGAMGVPPIKKHLGPRYIMFAGAPPPPISIWVGQVPIQLSLPSPHQPLPRDHSLLESKTLLYLYIYSLILCMHR